MKFTTWIMNYVNVFALSGAFTIASIMIIVLAQITRLISSKCTSYDNYEIISRHLNIASIIFFIVFMVCLPIAIIALSNLNIL